MKTHNLHYLKCNPVEHFTKVIIMGRQKITRWYFLEKTLTKKQQLWKTNWEKSILCYEILHDKRSALTESRRTEDTFIFWFDLSMVSWIELEEKNKPSCVQNDKVVRFFVNYFSQVCFLKSCKNALFIQIYRKSIALWSTFYFDSLTSGIRYLIYDDWPILSDDKESA